MYKMHDYFRFLADELTIEFIIRTRTGVKEFTDMPELSRHQFYTRLAKARKLGLLYKTNGMYYLTSLGEMFLNNINYLRELEPVEWMLRSVDKINDPEIKSQLIHQLFNDRPDIEKCLTGPN